MAGGPLKERPLVAVKFAGLTKKRDVGPSSPRITGHAYHWAGWSAVTLKKIDGVRFDHGALKSTVLRLRLRLSGGASTSPSGLLSFRLPSFLLEYWERTVHRLPDKLRRARVELPSNRNQPSMLVAGQGHGDPLRVGHGDVTFWGCPAIWPGIGRITLRPNCDISSELPPRGRTAMGPQKDPGGACFWKTHISADGPQRHRRNT